MLQTYASWTQRARQFLKDHDLVTFPEGEECSVEPSPLFQRPVTAVASYNSPPPFSPSMRGHFFVPFPPDGAMFVANALPGRLHPERRRHVASVGRALNAVVRHVAEEVALPLAVRKRDARCRSRCEGETRLLVDRRSGLDLVTSKSNPSAVRRSFRTPYFTEGWGLYAEQVMREQAFFTDPRQEMAQFEATLFRAARIIVDTSLHIGDMTFDEGVEFMQTRANLPAPTARAEVVRYCAWPTQASAYLTGCLEILRIRDRFMQSGRGTLREFHDKIARSGGLPIALAESAAMDG